MSVALADGLYEPLPTGLFQFKMDWDPTVLFFIGLAILYYRGLRAFRNRVPVKNWQIFCFYSGTICNLIALLPPVDPLSDRLFFMHMIQHMLIMMIGVPLVTLGAPFFVIARGLDKWTRSNVMLPAVKSRPLRVVLNFWGHPLIALAFFNLNLWFWHIPRFYNWALLNDFFHLLEHALFAFSAMLLWRNIIDAYPLKSRLHMGLRILYLAATMALSVGLSAYLTYQTEVIYAYEGIPMPEWWSYRWSHLDDQRLGGLIMWVPGGTLMFIYMTITFFVWAHREKQNEQKEFLESQQKIIV